MQAWKENVYPLLRQHMAQNVDSVLSYMLLFNEAAIANLLEVSWTAEGAAAVKRASDRRSSRDCTLVSGWD